MNNRQKVYICLIAIILIFTIFISYSFINNAVVGLIKEKEDYLLEFSYKNAESIKKIIESNIESINIISNLISSNGRFDLEKSLSQLYKFKNKQFRTLGIILPDGSAYSTDNLNTNLSHREYFKKAINGESNVSDLIIDSNYGNEINVYAAPVYLREKIVAVVFATKTQEQFSQGLKMEAFGGEGYSYIIKSDGKAVVKSDNPNSIGDFDNFYDVMSIHGISGEKAELLKNDISQGKSGCIDFIRDGAKRQLCYSKVGVNDWYVLSVVPDAAISLGSKNLITGLINLIIAINVLIAIILIFNAIVNVNLRNNNKSLMRPAYYDDIAQCSNWQKFSRDAKEIITKEKNTNFAMVMLDVIKFKVINDIYGYKIGNVVLQSIARAIDLNITSGETFCRISGDKFNILMKYESNEIIIERLDNIIKNIQGCFDTYNIRIVVGIYANFDKSLGIRVVSDRSGISKSIAKRQNYQWYHFYEEENRIDILKEKKIENAMERALKKGEFEVYFQPKYSLVTEEVYGAEALVRWNKPGVGIIKPDDFIPVFERNGFIRKLDLYMFERVCEIISRWKLEYPNMEILPVSVNISRVDLFNRELAHNLKKIAQKYNVNPEYIEIELIESAIFEDIDKLIDIMKNIKKEGFLVSIDDFGRGYSSLGAIKNLPVDFIKIDKSFLEDVDEKGEKLISSIISMIKTLGIFSVAEGVEIPEQVSFLKLAGCDIAQGYYFSEPITVSEFEKNVIIDNIVVNS